MRKQLASDPVGKAGAENQPECRPCRGQSLGTRHIPTKSHVLEGTNPAKSRALESGASLGLPCLRATGASPLQEFSAKEVLGESVEGRLLI